jgi:hypothetical protein
MWPRMATEIKKGNYKWLSALIAGNLVLYLAAIHASGLNGLPALQRVAGGVLGVGGVLALLVLLNGIIDPVDKARLIYWRWDNPLPGSRAFTVEAARDPRIDMTRLEEKLGPFPEEGPAQNSLWYQLYKPLAKEPAVLDAHRGYLLGRDYTIFALLQLLILGPLSLIQFTSFSWGIYFIAVLAIQCAVAWIAAAHYGRRLVTNVLALKTAQKT